jgi:leader peptidase (prepilin peptidase) / N-methyltransferase
VGGRSACDHCGAQVGAVDLIPIISFVALRGKCRACGGAIAARHVWIELAAALVAGAAMLVSPDASGMAGAVFGWLLLSLAITDATYFRLPNIMTGLLAATGLVAGLSGISPALSDRLIGGVAGFGGLALIALLYRLIRKREGLGGGDPKMLGAIGMWLGWQMLPLVLLGASVCGLIAVATRLLRGQRVAGDMALPFGSLMAAAAFAVWIWGAVQIGGAF